MRVIKLIGLTCVLTSSWLALGFNVELKQARGKTLIITATATTEDVAFQTLTAANTTFQKVNLSESSNPSAIGTPDLPILNRWIVVPQGTQAIATNTCEKTVTVPSIVPYPIQPDTIDDGSKAPFAYLKTSYLDSEWTNQIGGELNTELTLGNARVLPIRIHPMQYNPEKKELRYCEKMTMAVELLQSNAAVKAEVPTQFTRQQIKALTLNGEDYLKNFDEVSDNPKYLVVSRNQLASQAKQIGELAKARSGAEPAYLIIPDNAKAPEVKTLIAGQYQRSRLDAILILGDAKQIPLFKHNGGIMGDAAYSFLEGTDETADVALGRLPVADANEATMMVEKIKNFYDLKAAGVVEKKVMLIAHGEDYPEKYTRNMRNVKDLANPKGLKFDLEFGGEKATNGSVIDATKNRYSILNYRGHGGATEWWQWDRDSKSFGFNENKKLAEMDLGITFIFNVCCDSGNIEYASGSLVKHQLFPGLLGKPLHGAIGVLGSTQPSYTSVNHKFNLHLFQFMQNERGLKMGNLYALANNKLVMEHGGAKAGKAPENVLMYLLYADPLLVPLVD